MECSGVGAGVKMGECQNERVMMEKAGDRFTGFL